MARIPFVTSQDIPANEKQAFDSFVRERGSIPSAGPYALMLHMPEVAQRVESLRLCLRDEASLPQKLQELVMITVAREMDCAYIWHAHAAAARKIGVRDDIIDSLREQRTLTGLEFDQQAAVDFTRELLRNRKVSKPTFDRASASFGQRGTLALTNLVACYAVLAYNMNAYELKAPASGVEPALPV
ncbi:MAG TPA: carboxymuconolactone decarboxylase family protein [Burkholderiales bacterium]|nr:carboxymuconolactone decarboxylase family protein [Burkholderiales bacterium]